MNKRIFITGTGTGIGKTHITCALIAQAREAWKSVEALKPVISGYTPDGSDSDTVAILNALGLPPTPRNIDHISPWRYAAPLAPSMAARREGRPLDYDRLISYSRDFFTSSAEVVLIEGVGGLMVPLTDSQTVLDWLGDSGFEALLVAGSYLGSLSHTLTALEILKTRRIPLTGIVINETEASTVATQETANELRRWTYQIPVFESFWQQALPKILF